MSCWPLLLWGNLTLYIANTHSPTHRWMGTSVMRREESKSKGLSNVQGEKKEEGGKEGSEMGGKGKRERWKAGAGVHRQPRNF